MDFSHLVGKELKSLREQAGLTQNELAVKIGKDTDYLSKIERGKRTPSLKTLITIAKVLNVKLHDLFERVDL
ncbi:MAG: helix-turn-helix transcriptional regulator [Cyclobacteriaceae bacterium]